MVLNDERVNEVHFIPDLRVWLVKSEVAGETLVSLSIDLLCGGTLQITFLGLDVEVAIDFKRFDFFREVEGLFYFGGC